MTSEVVDRLKQAFAQRYPEVLFVEEAAEIARVSPKTIQSWSSQGKLEAFTKKVGRRLEIGRDEFVAYLFSQDIEIDD